MDIQWSNRIKNLPPYLFAEIDAKKQRDTIPKKIAKHQIKIKKKKKKKKQKKNKK